MEATMADTGKVDPTERVRGCYQQYAHGMTARRTTTTASYRGIDGPAVWPGSREVLEIAIGTGRNLPFYPRGIHLTGIDLTSAMLDVARDRAHHLGMRVDLIEADARTL